MQKLIQKHELWWNLSPTRSRYLNGIRCARDLLAGTICKRLRGGSRSTQGEPSLWTIGLTPVTGEQEERRTPRSLGMQCHFKKGWARLMGCPGTKVAYLRSPVFKNEPALLPSCAQSVAGSSRGEAWPYSNTVVAAGTLQLGLYSCTPCAVQIHFLQVWGTTPPWFPCISFRRGNLNGQ